MCYTSRPIMEETENRIEPLPLPTIRRYPSYLREIRAMVQRGELHVSSAVIAEKLGLDQVLTRKDLAMAGVPGKPRCGYPARELERAIVHALGWDNVTDAVLVGAGSLGQALLGYRGFEEHNLSISLAFDSDPAKTLKEIHGVVVRPMEDLPLLVKRLKIKIGILTVPRSAAQACASTLVEAGISGIWNFTPEQLDVPEGIVVQNVDLAQSLAVLSHAITRG